MNKLKSIRLGLSLCFPVYFLNVFFFTSFGVFSLACWVNSVVRIPRNVCMCKDLSPKCQVGC